MGSEMCIRDRVIVLARASREDSCGSHVALDMKLPSSGMSLGTHGQQFLELVDHVDSFSRGDHTGPGAPKAIFDVGPEEAAANIDGESLQ